MSFEVSEVEKDSDVWSKLYALFQVTDPENLGFGRDVRSTDNYTGLTPVCAWSIDVPARMNKYLAAVEEVEDALSSNELELPKVKTKLDEVAEDLFEDGLHEDFNEKVLLHGTRPQTLLTLLQNGLSERFSSGLFGSGSYLSEDPSKIDQYCTPDSQEEDKELQVLHEKLFEECDVKPVKNMFYAIVCRVALGFPVFTKDGDTNLHPPHNNIFANNDKRELALIPFDAEVPVHYHSLIAERGPACEGYKCGRHREFIIFDSARIIEEYIIGYVRDIAPLLPGVNQEALGNVVSDDAVEAEGGAKSVRAPAPKAPTEFFPISGIDTPLGIAISPCGTFALVGNNSKDSQNWKVGRIDLKCGKLSFPYDVLSGPPSAVAIAPDGSFALVTDNDNAQIILLDILNEKVTESFATHPQLTDPVQVAISPCGTFALVACEESKVARINLSGNSKGDVTFPWGDLDFSPTGIAIAPDSKYVLFSYESNIARLDWNMSEQESFQDGRLDVSGHVSIAPSGGFALVGAYPCHARMDLRTDEITFVDDYEEDGLDIKDPMSLSIAPSENYALVTCGKTGKVFCISNSTKTWKPLPAPDYTEDESNSCCCSVQ